MKEILDVIHKTIYQFFDVCGDDDEEMPLTDKDKLLLKINKAICNELKALELDQNWIPVSVRLPKKRKKVLISTTNGEVSKAYRREKEWTTGQFEWVVHEMLGYCYTYTDEEVLAWQPLPESYKPKNEEPSDNTDRDETLPPIIW